MRPRAFTAIVSFLPATVATAATLSPAIAAAPVLPNPCRLLTQTQIVNAVHPATTHAVVMHTTYSAGTAYEDKVCTWRFGTTLHVTVNVYNKRSGSGGPATKTTQEPSLGPYGKLTQSANPRFKFTIVSFKRHTHFVDINIDRDVAPRAMLKLGSEAYQRT